jgi:hypothetical protein
MGKPADWAVRAEPVEWEGMARTVLREQPGMQAALDGHFLRRAMKCEMMAPSTVPRAALEESVGQGAMAGWVEWEALAVRAAQGAQVDSEEMADLEVPVRMAVPEEMAGTAGWVGSEASAGSAGSEAAEGAAEWVDPADAVAKGSWRRTTSPFSIPAQSGVATVGWVDRVERAERKDSAERLAQAEMGVPVGTRVRQETVVQAVQAMRATRTVARVEMAGTRGQQASAGAAD